MEDFNELLTEDDLKTKNIMIRLKWSHKFAFSDLELKLFIHEHGWKVEDWQDVDFITRNIDFKTRMLLKLPMVYRRNFLTAEQKLTRKELASLLDISPASVSNLLDMEKIHEPKSSILTAMAIIFDIPEIYICQEVNRLLEVDYFVEFERFGSIVELSDLNHFIYTSISNKRIIKGFILTQKHSLMDKRQWYCRLDISDMIRFEFYTDTKTHIDEVLFVLKWLKMPIHFIIRTLATLRKNKIKWIFIANQNYTDDNTNMFQYVSEMKKNKNCLIYAVIDGEVRTII